MELLPPDDTCSSQLLAAMLLDAWLSGDRYRLLWELDRMAALPPASRRRRRMRPDGNSDQHRVRDAAQADLFAPRTASARIGVWMDLLDHLSDRGKARSN